MLRFSNRTPTENCYIKTKGSAGAQDFNLVFEVLQRESFSALNFILWTKIFRQTKI